MTTYVLEMRSTANWQDVRYREYTTSAKKAKLFETVPKIKFTDSGHGIVPHVKEHRGRREPRNMVLADHVRDHIIAMSKCHCGKNGHALNSINCPTHGRKEKTAADAPCHYGLQEAEAWASGYNLALSGTKGE